MCVVGVLLTVGVIAVILLLIGVVGTIADRRSGRRAFGDLGGRTILVYTRKRGWNETIVNNVLPLLPPERVRVLVRQCLTDPVNHTLYRLVGEHCWRSGHRESMPYLISLTTAKTEKARVVGLHKSLLPFKRSAKRSAATQAAIRPILDEALREHGIVLNAAAPPSSPASPQRQVIDGNLPSELH
jgi:hypothetical protein